MKFHFLEFSGICRLSFGHFRGFSLGFHNRIYVFLEFRHLWLLYLNIWASIGNSHLCFSLAIVSLSISRFSLLSCDGLLKEDAPDDWWWEVKVWHNEYFQGFSLFRNRSLNLLEFVFKLQCPRLYFLDISLFSVYICTIPAHVPLSLVSTANDTGINLIGLSAQIELPYLRYSSARSA